MRGSRRTIVAFSGDSRTSAAMSHVKQQFGGELITVSLDLGQGQELEEVRDRALAAGAARAHVLDARETFAAEYICPALQAQARWSDGAPVIGGLSSPAIARKIVDVAVIEEATAIVHAAHTSGGRPGRLDVAIRALAPHLDVMGPADWGMKPQHAVAGVHTD